MFTQTSAIAYTRKFLDACKTLPFKIDKAMLFGSVVNNSAVPYSDIDVALFSNSFSDNILQNLDLIGKIAIHFPDLDVHTFPTADLSKKGMLLNEIKTTGIEINP
jgi:predicted nucleotidyltransferase